MDLPPTLSTREFAYLIGVSTDHIWKTNREGQMPFPPLKLGRALRWPTAKLLEWLGDDSHTIVPGAIVSVPDDFR